MARGYRMFTWAGLAVLACGFLPAVGWAQFGSLQNPGTQASSNAAGAGGGNSLSGSSLANSISGMNANRGMDAQSLRGFGGADVFRSAIGADMMGQQSIGRQMMGMGMMGRMGGQFGNQFGMNQQQNNQKGKVQLRIPMRLGFATSAAKRTARSNQFAKRVPNIPGLKNIQGLTVEMAGETAILRGVVDSEEQRELVERMAKLEPGISAVQNELQVAAATENPTPTGSAEELPPIRNP